MAERIEPGVTRGPDRISFAALDVDILNAAAIPGNHIIVFKKIIRDGRSPDELAGVLAHEIAHVRRRHVTEALLRELGIGALIRLFAGGIGANTQQLVSLSYTRANEAQADADAIESLKRAGIDPRPTADLFARLGSKNGDNASLQWLQSHPASGGRAKRFAASYDPKTTYRPAISDTHATALYDVCLRPDTRPSLPPPEARVTRGRNVPPVRPEPAPRR